MFKKRLWMLMFPEGDATGGGAAPAAASADPAPAAAAPSTPAAEPAEAAVKPAPDGSIVSDVEPAKPADKPADAPEFDAAAAKAKLIEKGAKAEDLDKLSPEELQKKSEEADKPKEITADDYKFNTPEGVELDEAKTKEFKDVMADPKLSPAEKAQKLVDMHAAALKDATQAPYDLWSKTQAEWQTAVKADTELGGQKYDEVRSTIAKAVKAVGGDEAQKIFDAFAFTGAGNNPEIVRIMYRLSVAHSRFRTRNSRR